MKKLIFAAVTLIVLAFLTSAVFGEDSAFPDADVSNVAKDASDLLRHANRQILAKQFAKANKYLEDGIKSLGDLYYMPNVIDDTGMMLTLAEIEEKDGHIETSANLRKNVLTSRLSLYKTKFGISNK